MHLTQRSQQQQYMYSVHYVLTLVSTVQLWSFQLHLTVMWLMSTQSHYNKWWWALHELHLHSPKASMLLFLWSFRLHIQVVFNSKFKNETHSIFQLFILEKKATQTCQDFRNILYFFMILQLFDGVS